MSFFAATTTAATTTSSPRPVLEESTPDFPELLDALSTAVRDLDGSLERVLSALETLVRRRMTTAMDSITALREKYRRYGEVRVDLGHEDQIRALLREMDPLLILPDESTLGMNDDDLFPDAVSLFDDKYGDDSMDIGEELRWCDVQKRMVTWYYVRVTFPVTEDEDEEEPEAATADSE